MAQYTTNLRNFNGVETAKHCNLTGSSPRDMPSVFCPRMAPSPNIFARDGICYLPPSTAKRWKTASRVGPTSRVANGRP